MQKWILACICYAMVGLWGRCISYAYENCVLYQTRAYQMNANEVHFCVSVPRVFVLFGVLFIRFS